MDYEIIQSVSFQCEPLHITRRAPYATYMHDGLPILHAEGANIEKTVRYVFLSLSMIHLKFLFLHFEEIKIFYLHLKCIVENFVLLIKNVWQRRGRWDRDKMKKCTK